jgi:F-type H+-transporting ATPase subunit b
MELQWGQIVTQIIGFLLAVWLLKRYAWEGLLNFMEKRREAIASSFEEIDKKKLEVEEEKSRYETELANIESTRRAKIQEAAHEASKLASEIKDEARKDSVAMREKARQDIAIELDKANAMLRDRIVDAVIVSTEKVIKDRLDLEKHKQLIRDFIDEATVEKRRPA